jgi:hypothetical protein
MIDNIIKQVHFLIHQNIMPEVLVISYENLVKMHQEMRSDFITPPELDRNTVKVMNFKLKIVEAPVYVTGIEYQVFGSKSLGLPRVEKLT